MQCIPPTVRPFPLVWLPLERASRHVCSLSAADHACTLPLLPRPPSTPLQLRFKRFLACARNKLWWMTPEWGSRGDQLPPETQFLLLELEEAGLYGLVLPLIDGDFRGTLRPNRWGRGVRGGGVRGGRGEVGDRVAGGREGGELGKGLVTFEGGGGGC